MTSSYSTFLTSNPDFELDTRFPPPRPSIDTRNLQETTQPLEEEPGIRRSYSTKTSGSASSSQLPLRKSLLWTSHSPPPRSPRMLKSTVRTFDDPKRGRISKAFSTLFGRKAEADIGIPIQEVPSSEAESSRHDLYAEVEGQMRGWPALHIEKRPQQAQQLPLPCQHCQCKNKKVTKKKKRDRLCIGLLIIIILYLLANSIVLNVRVFDGSSSSSDQLGTSNDSYTLSAEQQLCLLEFEINAPANASTYPCSTCLSELQQIPSDFSFANSSNSQLLSNSIQFCGLRSLLTASTGTALTDLVNGGWSQDTSFCTWSGVQCNSQGQVQNLTMDFPGVPSVIPSGIGVLTTLQTLTISGGDSLPGGSLPTSFANLTSLITLDLENTGLSALDSDLFDSGGISGLTTLTLVKNTAFAGSLPDLSGLSLNSLTVDDQQISTALDSLLGSSSLQNSLTTLSLIAANLTGTFPSASFPRLHTLTLTDNPSTSGSLPSSLCEALTSCDLSETSFDNKGSCGVCTS